jgi:class 3 adenylate cyclase
VRHGETPKIAAILVADIVGYSRLTAADEVRTLSRLRGLRSDNAATVHVAGPEGLRASFTLAELLPESFGPDHLRTA